MAHGPLSIHLCISLTLTLTLVTLLALFDTVSARGDAYATLQPLARRTNNVRVLLAFFAPLFAVCRWLVGVSAASRALGQHGAATACSGGLCGCFAAACS
jgi:hypothetical protein